MFRREMKVMGVRTLVTTESDQPAITPVDHVAAPPRMSRIATSFTTRCNLRCVYCPEGSHPEEFYGDMSPELLGELISYAKQKNAYVDISFYGDSTFHDQFYDFANQIIEAGVSLAITSNFARLLREEEIAVIARCRTVAFSVDTHDRDAAKAIRKGLDLRTLVFNIVRVRAYCFRNGLRTPPLTLHAVLVDKTVRDLPKLVALAAAFGVNRVGCNELAEMDGARGGLQNIADLRGLELMAAVASIKEAIALAAQLGVQFYFSGEQLARINAAASGKVDQDGPRLGREGIQGTYYFRGDEALELQSGMTRKCIEPWLGPILSPKGEVYPCCARGTVMGVVGEEGSFADVHDNDAHRKLRLSLLTGENLDAECRLCHLAPQTTPAELSRIVASLYT